MFRIKQCNMVAFVAHEEAQFVVRLSRRLRRTFGRLRTLDDDALQAFIRLGKIRAAEHEVTSCYGVSVYVGLMALLGPDFDRCGTHPWAEAWLAHDDFTGDARVQIIWQEAKERGFESV
jgi:hypothetical protein